MTRRAWRRSQEGVGRPPGQGPRPLSSARKDQGRDGSLREDLPLGTLGDLEGAGAPGRSAAREGRLALWGDPGMPALPSFLRLQKPAGPPRRAWGGCPPPSLCVLSLPRTFPRIKARGQGCPRAPTQTPLWPRGRLSPAPAHALWARGSRCVCVCVCVWPAVDTCSPAHSVPRNPLPGDPLPL